MAKKRNNNTDLCVDIKTKLTTDRVAKVGKHYSGLLVRDTESHYTFRETPRPSKGSRTPQVFNGKYITVTCSKDGSLRINFKAVFLTVDFLIEDYLLGVTQELKEAFTSLLGK